MLTKPAALAACTTLWVSPAFAADHNDRPLHSIKAQGRPITAMTFRDREFEMVAVTARARADTTYRKDYLKECQSMAKAMPGYPQPALVTLDVRMKF